MGRIKWLDRDSWTWVLTRVFGSGERDSWTRGLEDQDVIVLATRDSGTSGLLG